MLLLIIHIVVFAVTLPQYLTKFQWDLAKYPIKQSLKNICDIISKVELSGFGFCVFDGSMLPRFHVVVVVLFVCCRLIRFDSASMN